MHQFSTPSSFKERPEQIHLKNDYIGPPDKDSNIRPIVRHSSPIETELEYTLRNRQNEIQQWNQEFWTSHNKRFIEVSIDPMKLWATIVGYGIIFVFIAQIT